MSATLLSKFFPWVLPGSQCLLPNKANEKRQRRQVEEALGLESEDDLQLQEAKNELCDPGLVV